MRRAKEYEYADLATYNSEVARGIAHTPEWVESMRQQQARFDAVQAERAEREGWIIVPAGGTNGR